MPGLIENSSGCRILLLPQSALKEGAKAGALKILRLMHPRRMEPALYLLNSQSNQLYEILSFTEEHRAWFLGERILDDGTLLLSTPINPTFLILPYLISAERNVPLEDLLDRPEFPHLNLISGLSSGLRDVARQLGDPELHVWKYEEEKCLAWLQGRVQAVAKVLEQQQIDLSGGAASLLYKQESSAAHNPDEYTRYSLGIVSEYLPPDLVHKLKLALNLPEPEKLSVKRQSEGGGAPSAKKGKLMKEEPAEDYSKNYKKGAAKDSELSAKQKALAKAAGGTKNIMSFFTKK